jgi:hypothetical protein
MPPDAPYPMQRSQSDQPPHHSRELVRDDYSFPSRSLTRSRSAYDIGRSPSYDNLDRGFADDHRIGSRGHHHKHHHNTKKFNHVTAGLAGALAGGYVGKKVSKGDTVATIAGALVGALGASVADREYERHRKKEKKEKFWDHGGRYRY